MGKSQTRISVPPKKSEKILTISISLAVVECGETKFLIFYGQFVKKMMILLKKMKVLASPKLSRKSK